MVSVETLTRFRGNSVKNRARSRIQWEYTRAGPNGGLRRRRKVCNHKSPGTCGKKHQAWQPVPSYDMENVPLSVLRMWIYARRGKKQLLYRRRKGQKWQRVPSNAMDNVPLSLVRSRSRKRRANKPTRPKAKPKPKLKAKPRSTSQLAPWVNKYPPKRYKAEREEFVAIDPNNPEASGLRTSYKLNVECAASSLRKHYPVLSMASKHRPGAWKGVCPVVLYSFEHSGKAPQAALAWTLFLHTRQLKSAVCSLDGEHAVAVWKGPAKTLYFVDSNGYSRQKVHSVFRIMRMFGYQSKYHANFEQGGEGTCAAWAAIRALMLAEYGKTGMSKPVTRNYAEYVTRAFQHWADSEEVNMYMFHGRNQARWGPTLAERFGNKPYRIPQKVENKVRQIMRDEPEHYYE